MCMWRRSWLMQRLRAAGHFRTLPSVNDAETQIWTQIEKNNKKNLNTNSFNYCWNGVEVDQPESAKPAARTRTGWPKSTDHDRIRSGRRRSTSAVSVCRLKIDKGIRYLCYDAIINGPLSLSCVAMVSATANVRQMPPSCFRSARSARPRSLSGTL